MTLRTVVFDMDGTLVKTRAASWEVFQATATQFGLPVHSAEDFFALFEGNFFQSLDSICPDQETADAVRQHLLTGLKERYEPDFVPGMVDVIKSLAPHYALAVMSSNSMDAIRRILQNAGVAQCFAHVFSAEVGPSKRDHLGRILADPAYGGVRQCSPDYLEGHLVNEAAGNQEAEVALITDTVGDVIEATQCGVRAIGVAWGMHGADALLAAGAERVVFWPQEITAMLLPQGDRPAQTCVCSSTGACALKTAPSVEPGTSGLVARLGRERHARRTRAAATRACRCGRGCGVTDAVHSCGTGVAAPDRRILTSGQSAGLMAAIARIAPRPP